MCHYCALLVNDATRLNGHADRGSPVIVTYAFAAPADLPAGYATADNRLKAAVRTAVDIAEATAGLRFVEVEAGADEMMTFAYNGDRQGWSWAFFPTATEDDPDISGGIAMNRFYGSYAPGSGGFQVLLHEIGHAMGLKHPHDGTPRLPGRLDNTNNTIMSYNWRGPEKAAYQSLDRAALEALYGEAGGLAGVGIAWNGERDILSVTGTRRGETLIGVNDRSAIAGRGGNDSLVGRGDDDTLSGGRGADTLKGHDGADSLTGGARGDRAFGGWHDDRVLGNAGHDTLAGGAGSDFVRGGRGRDRLFGGADNDTLVGDAGADIIIAHSGDDRLVGGPGNDRLTGGRGADVFVVKAGGGADHITDFDVGEGDRLNARDLDLTPEEALDRLAVRGDHMVFDTGSHLIRLLGQGDTTFIGSDFIV